MRRFMRRTAAVLGIWITTSLGTSQACDSPPCNQTWTGILSGIGNLALQPLENLRQVRDYVTGNTYSDYINKTRRQRASQNNSCTIPVAGTGAEHVEPLAKSVRASACSCRPWGNCSPSLCNCGVLCPDSFDILSIHGIEIAALRHTSSFLGTTRATSAARESPMDTVGGTLP